MKKNLLIILTIMASPVLQAEIDVMTSLNISSPTLDETSDSCMMIGDEDEEYEIKDNDIFFNIPYTSIMLTSTTNYIFSHSKTGLGLSIEGLLGMSGSHSSNIERPQYVNSVGLIDFGLSLGPSYKSKLNENTYLLFDLKPGMIFSIGEFYMESTEDLLLKSVGSALLIKPAVKYVSTLSNKNKIILGFSYTYGMRIFSVSSEETNGKLRYSSYYHNIYLGVGVSL